MSEKDDLRSVRIEIEDAPVAVGAAGQISAASGGQSRAPIIAVVALLVAVGAGLFALSPDTDRAADGTERSAPTTSLPPSEDESAEEAQEADDEDDLAQVPLADAISAVPANTADGFRRIVETDDGYLALIGDHNFGEPGPLRLSRSTDGVQWSAIEATFTSESADAPTELFWDTVWPTDDGFAALAFDPEAFFVSSIATSTDGVAWTLLDGGPSVADGEGIRSLPIGASGNSIIEANLLEQPVAAVLRMTTGLDLPEEAICGLFRSPGAPEEYELFSCADGESSFVGADDVGAEWSADLVMGCLGSIADANGFSDPVFPIGFAEVDRTDGSITPLGLESSAWNPTAVPLPLRLGGVAIVDAGQPASGTECDDFVDMPEQREPSVVVLEAGTGREGVFELPEATDRDSTTGFFGAQIIGETQEFADRAPHLLVSLNGNLWSLNTTWGEWTQIFDPEALGIDTNGAPFRLSTNGDRVYQPTADGLLIIELREDDGGVLGGSVRLAPIGPAEWFSSVQVSGAQIQILFGSNEQVLLSDDDNQLWVLDAPPAEDSTVAPGTDPNSLIPEPIQLPNNGGLVDVMATNTGLLGLGFSGEDSTFELFTSTDGASWATADAVAEGSWEDLTDQSWPYLEQTTTGFSLMRATVNVATNSLQVERYDSSDGETWTRNDAFGTIVLDETTFPVGLLRDGVLGTSGQSSFALVEELVRTHTDIDLDLLELCDVFSPTSGAIALLECGVDDLEWTKITEASVTSAAVPARVIACLEAASGQRVDDLVWIGQATDTPELLHSSVDGVLAPWAITSVGEARAYLAAGDEVVAASCEGIAPSDLLTEPAVVLIGPSRDDVRSVPTPAGEFRSIIGQLQVGGGPGYLLVAIDDDLAALDLATGEWVDVSVEVPEDVWVGGLFPSTDGDRIYGFGSELLIWDVVSSGQGSLRFERSDFPVRWAGAGAGDLFEGQILHADSEIILVETYVGSLDQSFQILEVPLALRFEEGSSE